MPIACPSCGEENPDRARYCMVCAEPLAAAPPKREERKVVSVLFVDLVGFTARSEMADPEDVRAELQRYHSRAKAEIERFGGTVEKFVGDAVMAVFGAPVAHEDDAERAVRAGLAILDALSELELHGRAGVNTGEAVVALAARPERGEGIATGDVVNTAARLQSSAPPGSLVASEQTYWATRHAIDYEPLEAVTAKGKAAPVSLWRALGARSRFGVDLEPSRQTPFLGRDDELEVVRQVYARTLRESACHLVTLVGEPGIGKSRLVAELREFVDAREELVSWRQGRCLPYGEGIALWALGEIVKAHAGILESDDPATVRDKLSQVLEPLLPSEAEKAWVAGELARLTGAGDGGGEREESFAAWRTFLEAVATQGPLVVVVEDLHWADAGLLDFLEHLVDWTAGVPLLVICTARPELHELHPAWSGGKRNATTISLSPLSSDDTSRLIAALLERSVLPAETQQALLERAGGNPLYAEQFVQMLRERPTSEDVPVPETVQALIAARLDTLGPERKALLQDAAVVGKVFWSGAVAAVGGLDERAVREGLHDLVRRELVRPSRLSSVEGQAEFAFGHGLVRDVAYAQIPRAARAVKHVAAARWIEGIAGERVVDHAELLAHHYREALALAGAAGLALEGLEDEARRFLVLAAERAAAIDVGRARALFDEALAITPPGHPTRGRILTTSRELASGDAVAEDVAVLEEAIAELRSAGDHVGVGKAMLVLSHITWLGGDTGRAEPLLRDAAALLERHEPGPELAHAYALLAGRNAIAGRSRDALDWAERGMELARRLGLENFVERSRQFRGLARCDLGDLGGLDDLREALRASLERGLTREAEIGFNNLGSWLWLSEGAEAAIPVYRDAVEFYERRGRSAGWSRAEMTWALLDAGRWDELLDVTRAVEDEAEGRGYGQPLIIARASKARVLFYRGQLEEAGSIARDLLPRARAVGDPQVVDPTLSLAALVEPDRDAAVALAEELLGRSGEPTHPDVARVCVRHGALDVAERMITGDERAAPRIRHVGVSVRAILAEARGERAEAVRLYREAAERWTVYPFVLERAQCLLGLARSGDDAAAAEAARALFRSLRATPLEAQADALLRAA
ncbi:MAG: AAA family ATPase [Thermoleophilia bacterium]|nr:AAA family ATPase [Thermoleophilia bacterium]